MFATEIKVTPITVSEIKVQPITIDQPAYNPGLLVTDLDATFNENMGNVQVRLFWTPIFDGDLVVWREGIDPVYPEYVISNPNAIFPGQSQYFDGSVAVGETYKYRFKKPNGLVVSNPITFYLDPLFFE